MTSILMALGGIWNSFPQTIKMQRAAALEDPKEKIAEYQGAAALWETELPEQKDSATSAWQKILEVDATHDEAFSQLERLHTAAFDPQVRDVRVELLVVPPSVGNSPPNVVSGYSTRNGA